MGFYGSKGPFWAIPSMILTGTAAASGIAWINSVGNLGGFFGPTMVGWAKDYTGSFAAGLYALAGFALLSAVVGARSTHSQSGATGDGERAGGVNSSLYGNDALPRRKRIGGGEIERGLQPPETVAAVERVRMPAE
jgi:hypothetical protein